MKEFICKPTKLQPQSASLVRNVHRKNFLGNIISLVLPLPTMRHVDNCKISVSKHVGLKPFSIFEGPRLWMSGDIKNKDNRKCVKIILQQKCSFHKKQNSSMFSSVFLMWVGLAIWSNGITEGEAMFLGRESSDLLSHRSPFNTERTWRPSYRSTPIFPEQGMIYQKINVAYMQLNDVNLYKVYWTRLNILFFQMLVSWMIPCIKGRKEATCFLVKVY